MPSSAVSYANQYVRLTDALVQSLKPQAKAYIVKDSELKQLRVIVQTSGVKGFYVQYGQKKRKIADVVQLSVKQARAEANKLLAAGLDRSRLSGKTLEVAFEEYLGSRQFSKGFESNLKQAKRIFSRLLPKAVETISKEDVANSIITAKKANGGELADSTKDSALNVLSSVFTYQIALDVIEDNPVKNTKKRIPKLSVNKRSNRLSNEEELSRFLEWFNSGVVAGSGVSYKNVQDFELTKFAVAFLLLTGARVGEVIGLKKEDFWLNLESLKDVEGLPKFRTVTFRETKNGKDHTLQVTKHANAILLQAIDLTSEDNPYVFRCESRGNVVSENSMYSRIERTLKKVVVNNESLKPHDLRRTFAYLSTMAGITEDEIGIVLNHTKGTITERYKGELTEKTHGILSRYESYLGRLLTAEDGVNQYKGIGLITGDTREIDSAPLSEVKSYARHIQDGYEDYYN